MQIKKGKNIRNSSIRNLKRQNRQKKLLDIHHKINNLQHRNTFIDSPNMKINQLPQNFFDGDQVHQSDIKLKTINKFLTHRTLIQSQGKNGKILDSNINIKYNKKIQKQEIRGQIKTSRDQFKEGIFVKTESRQKHNKTSMSKFGTKSSSFYSFDGKKIAQRTFKLKTEQSPIITVQPDIIDRPATKFYSSVQQLQKYDGNQLSLVKQIVKQGENTYLTKQDNSSINLWTQYQIRSNKIIKTKEREWQHNTVFTQQQKKVKILMQTMKLMQFLLEQHDNKIIEIDQKIQYCKNQQLKKYYSHNHILYQRFMDIKTGIEQNNHEYIKYLERLKKQEHQHRQMMNSKRQSLNVSPRKNLNHLKILAGININDEQIKQLMQKKSKLNLQLDLSFQIQQRKNINKQKQTFIQKKNNFIKQKENIEIKIKQLKQKIFNKEGEVQNLEYEKQKLQRERELFLKVLLKNTEYRLDGVIWTLRKIIQYGCQLKKQDFSDNLDEDAKQFIFQQYNKMKRQNIFQIKPLKRKVKKVVKKTKKVQNRQRVKSMTLVKQQNLDQSHLGFDFSDDFAQNRTNQKRFFSFGSKLLQAHNKIPSIRKKSGSVLVPKSHQEALRMIQDPNNKSIAGNQNFKQITKINNRKKIYQSSQNFIKNWINKQGWKSLSLKNIQKPMEKQISSQFIAQEKNRIKKRYFKIGGTNTKYNSIVKTIFGVQKSVQTARRLKTSR